MKWCRLWNGTATDPKIRAVAVEAKQPVHVVLAVWMSMLCHASAASPRGTLKGWHDGIAAAALDVHGADVLAVRTAMQGLLLVGDQLSGWEQRQFDSDTSTSRVRKHRNGKVTTPTSGPPDGNGDETPCNGDGTFHDPETPEKPVSETPCNGDGTFPPLRATDSRIKETNLTTTVVSKPPGASDAAMAVASSFAVLRSEFWPDDPSFGAPAMTIASQAQEWLSQGLAPGDIEAVMRRACEDKRRRKDGPPTNLGFVRLSLRSAVARLQPAGEGEGASPPPPAQMSPDEAQWRSRLTLWLSGIDWQWGPAPDRPGTRVPKALRAEFADAIRGRDAKVEAR